MKTTRTSQAAVLACVLAGCGLAGVSPAQTNSWGLYAVSPVSERAYETVEFADEQLDRLLAPIALYPDPLLAQILPAATYPFDVVLAAQWLKSHPNPDDRAIEAQDWDQSVKALVRFPAVLQDLSDNAEWMQAVGVAFLNQQEDVLVSIQRLRQRALDLGNLVSTSEQQVVMDYDLIVILPASPVVIYVPDYNPTVIFIERRVRDPFRFRFSCRIGSWLGNALDWYHRWLAVGNDWHFGWRFEGGRWGRDPDRFRETTRILRFEKDRVVQMDAPVTRQWTRNYAKPVPTLPAALRPRPTSEDRQPLMPAAAPKARLELQPTRTTSRVEVRTPVVTAPGSDSLGSYQRRVDVQRESDRDRQSRPASEDRQPLMPAAAPKAKLELPPTRTTSKVEVRTPVVTAPRSDSFSGSQRRTDVQRESDRAHQSRPILKTVTRPTAPESATPVRREQNPPTSRTLPMPDSRGTTPALKPDPRPSGTRTPSSSGLSARGRAEPPSSARPAFPTTAPATETPARSDRSHQSGRR